MSQLKQILLMYSHLTFCDFKNLQLGLRKSGYLTLSDYKTTVDQKECTFLLYFSVELAMIMDRLYGGVCYAGIDTDPELKYPKGAGRVAFSNQQSYIAAISARFVQLQHGEIDKRVRPIFVDSYTVL